MTVHNIPSEATFASVIRSNKTVVVDFYAVWCGPCKVLAPLFERHSNEGLYKDIYFAKIDVDKLSRLSDELDIQAMPTLLMFRDGEKSAVVVDPNPSTLADFLNKAV